MVQKMELGGKKEIIKKDLLIIMPAYNEEKKYQKGIGTVKFTGDKQYSGCSCYE